MVDIRESIRAWIQENRQEGIKLLKRFVQEASTQGNEKHAQAIVVEKLRQIGLKIDIWEPTMRELRKQEAFVTTRESFEDSPNVVGVLKGRGGGRSLILNGHIDVVPEGDLAQWSEAPYSAVVRDGKLYGRGATDMKGGNVALLLAIQAIQELNISLKGDVIFQSVIEEESGGAGTLACIVRGYKADGAIIPEPTNMKIFPKQQGSMWFRLTINGRSAHGGTRYEGVSAIEKAMNVVTHVLDLEKKRNERINDPLYQHIPIPIPINLGSIKGGSWPSSVPDEVIIEGRMGVAPGEQMSHAKQELQTWIGTLKEKDQWFEQYPVQVEWFGAHWLPSELDVEHELVQTLTKSFQEVKKNDPVIEASPWGTDGGMLTNIGHIPTIVFGPGVTEMAHFPNEYIELNTLFEAAEIIALMMLDWCGVSE
ncbi:peptidase [Metabacillus iocasae]|uniref:Acetylornithine deacetylase n=1 Tax=Priestia iocasae TaxID=2291674 RepID=A0ABS2QUL1_9BACI|nr:peptidase [Metabacillus iocasae]MBM7703183.1 acetylornithine deacetylase [Metabacillus iocasae]